MTYCTVIGMWMFQLLGCRVRGYSGGEKYKNEGFFSSSGSKLFPKLKLINAE